MILFTLPTLKELETSTIPVSNVTAVTTKFVMDNYSHIREVAPGIYLSRLHLGVLQASTSIPLKEVNLEDLKR